MTVSLNHHLKEKLENRKWLEPCLNGEANAFPFILAGNGTGALSPSFAPRHSKAIIVIETDSSAPLFLMNIPMGLLPANIHSANRIQRLMSQIQNESFGRTPEESAPLVKQRSMVVLGINQVQSIDSSLNRKFVRFIRNLPTIKGVTNRIFGFFWKAQWMPIKTGVYPLAKSFLLLKSLFPQGAEKVRTLREKIDYLQPQIPYLAIRERIKNSNETRAFAHGMAETAPNAPIYYTTMDSDFVSLREGELGAFSGLESLIASNHLPSIASLGYSLPPNEAPLLKLAVAIDMAVRSTMPMPYFPEPLSVFKVRAPQNPVRLDELSFGQKGNKLESRRLIENSKNLLTDGSVFNDAGGVVTATPLRMRTNYNQAVQEITLSILKRKQTLQALRSNRIQSHAFPKQWADILYAGLPFKYARVTDVTSKMMHIFGVFDPISRMFALSSRYHSNHFDQVMTSYSTPLSATQREVLRSAKLSLYNLGMKAELIDLIESTARRSGRKIYEILQSKVRELRGSL